ncbi:sigma factor [Actinoplanes sp. NPDC048967]|uniref:sigma factor n=1 Tax=Actinoplanes sp. NPDC048967 TaxID=3155269 RepID=UPI0033F1E801
MGRADDDFVEDARASANQLRRTAYLLCRDWDLAADLTQTTLARMFVHWPRITRRDNPHAYARQVLSRAFLDHHRRATGRSWCCATGRISASSRSPRSSGCPPAR